MNATNLTLDIEQEIIVKAPIGEVFAGLMHRFGPGNTAPGDQPMPMVLEQRPGGRWFRDLGNEAGHLWGHVQVIKPPALLEISGPLFMSYPAINHLSVRLAEIDGGTKVSLRHRAFGIVEQGHRDGVMEGWQYALAKLKQECE